MTNILLLHGALGNIKQMRPIGNLLSSRYNVHYLEFSGHSGIPIQDEFSMELFSRDLSEFIKSHKIAPVSIFGYSMGGYVALNLAGNDPALIDRIVTLGTKFDWSPESASKETKMLIPSQIEAKVPSFAEKLKTEHGHLNWIDVVKKTAGMMLALSEGKKLFDHDMKRIANHIRIGIGSKDKMVTLEESKKVADLLPNGDLLILLEVQHPLELVPLSKVEELVFGFIPSSR